MRKNRGLQRLAQILEVPADAVLDISRLTMLGNEQLLIENHRGIVEYTPCFIRINLNAAVLQITGSDMVLGNLQADQILIEGRVEAIRYDA